MKILIVKALNLFSWTVIISIHRTECILAKLFAIILEAHISEFKSAEFN